MSILDSAKYCQLYLKVFNKEKNILNLKTVKYLTKPIIKQGGIWDALGWNTSKKNKLNRISHGGSFNDTYTNYYFVPDKDIGIVICSNIEGPVNGFILKEFLKTI